MNATAKHDAVHNMRHVTMTVRIVRFTELRWRLWLGVKLIALAGLVWTVILRRVRA